MNSYGNREGAQNVEAASKDVDPGEIRMDENNLRHAVVCILVCF